jgi:putative monooxygenase
MNSRPPNIKALTDCEPNTKRGGKLLTLLGPKTVGSTSGFMGVLTLAPGEKYSEHFHTYSEEFFFLVRGSLMVDMDGVTHPLNAGEGVFIAKGTKHRLRNEGPDEAFGVFHCGPLAPKPELGHVDTE